MKKYIITIISLFIIILISLGGYFWYSNAKSNESNSVQTLQEKCLSEINYLGTEIIEMANMLNNISYTNFEIQSKEIEGESQQQGGNSGGENSGENGQESSDETGQSSEENRISTSVIQYDSILTHDDEKIDWTTIKSKIENMHSMWTTVLIDLTTLKVNKDNLLKYNDILDEVIISLEEENKQSTLAAMANLFDLLSIYAQDFCEDTSIVSLLQVKSNILYAYSSVEANNWDKINEYVEIAKQKFTNIMNMGVNDLNKVDINNKAYVLINELQTDLDSKNNKIFYINYKNLMQELEAIST